VDSEEKQKTLSSHIGPVPAENLSSKQCACTRGSSEQFACKIRNVCSLEVVFILGSIYLETVSMTEHGYNLHL